MNILFVGCYKQLDPYGQLFYNYLGSLNTIPNINIVARPIQYNSLSRDNIDSWCIQLEQKDRFETTNYSIRLHVSNLDRRFNFYKIAVIERTDVNGK